MPPLADRFAATMRDILSGLPAVKACGAQLSRVRCGPRELPGAPGRNLTERESGITRVGKTTIRRRYP
ncbi:hypothetical protein FAIPA1_380001 [Frankia sp. AiPs1]